MMVIGRDLPYVCHKLQQNCAILVCASLVHLCLVLCILWGTVLGSVCTCMSLLFADSGD